MRVQQDVFVAAGLDGLGQLALEQLGNFFAGSAVIAAGLELAVVAEADDVRPQIGIRIRR